MLMVMAMTNSKTPGTQELPVDDISDAELEAIAEGMLRDVLARKASAQETLDTQLAKAMADAKAYFHPVQ